MPGCEKTIDLILFITFGVILLTLVVQGLTLPALIRKVKLPDFKDHRPEDETENYIREEMAKHAWDHLHTNYQAQLSQSHHLRQLAERTKIDIDARGETKFTNEIKMICLEVLEVQRQMLLQKNKKDPHLDEDLLRKHLHLIDVEEERLRLM